MASRPKMHKRMITGGSISAGAFGVSGGLGVSTSMFPTDAAHCRKLLDVIDDKRAFIDVGPRENGQWVVESLSEVRKMATATASLLESEEGVAEVKNIATACRVFMRDYDPGDRPDVLDACLEALRAEVGTSVEALRLMYGLPALVNFNTKRFNRSAIDVLEGWLNRP